jgi:hypothetical protein
LDPQEPRSKAPSLLTGDTQPASASKSPERILSGLQGTSASTPKPVRPRRWIWPLALVGVAAAAIFLLDVGGVFEPSKSEPASIASASSKATTTEAEPETTAVTPNAEPAAASTTAVAATDKPATGAQNAAVILADQFGPASSASTAATAPASSASSKDTAALGAMFAPHSGNKLVTPPMAHAVRGGATSASSSDSDVDLLAVLIKHLEVNDPTGKKAHARHAKKATADDDVLPQDCPPANTDAGIACRQRFCAEHVGQGDTSCPAASPGGA